MITETGIFVLIKFRLYQPIYIFLKFTCDQHQVTDSNQNRTANKFTWWNNHNLLKIKMNYTKTYAKFPEMVYILKLISLLITMQVFDFLTFTFSSLPTAHYWKALCIDIEVEQPDSSIVASASYHSLKCSLTIKLSNSNSWNKISK